MPIKKDQYLNDIWDQVTQYLLTNKTIEPEMISSFFQTSYIYELTEEHAIISVENVIHLQVLRSLVDKIADAFIHVLDLSAPIEIRMMQKSDIKALSEQNGIKYDENEKTYCYRRRVFRHCAWFECSAGIQKSCYRV